MMRLLRFAVAFLLLLALIGAGLYWWWQQRPSSYASARLLPSETLYYAVLPDGARSAVRYQGSQLQKVVESEDFKAIAVGMSALLDPTMPSDTQFPTPDQMAIWQKMSQDLLSSFSGESFFAVTSFQLDATPQIALAAGWRPITQPERTRAALTAFADALLGVEPNAVRSEGRHREVAYRSLTPPNGTASLTVLEHDGWFFTLWGQQQEVHQLIDRLHGARDLTTLATNERFNSLRKQAAGAPDALQFAQLDEFIKTLLNKIKTQPLMAPHAKALENVEAQVKAYPAMLFTSELKAGKRNDTMILLSPVASRPNHGKSIEPCAFKTLDYTSPDTVCYLGSNYDFAREFAILGETSAEMTVSLPEIKQTLSAIGIDLEKNILQPLGPEIAMVLDWAKDAPYPVPTLWIEVNNAESFRPVRDVLRSFTPFLQSLGELSVTSADGSDTANAKDLLITLRPHQFPALAPTLLLGHQQIGFSLDREPFTRLHQPKPERLDPFLISSLPKQGRGRSQSVVHIQGAELLQRLYPLALETLGSLPADVPLALSPELLQKAPRQLSFAKDLGDFTVATRVEGDYFISNAEGVLGLESLGLGIALAAIITKGKDGGELQPLPETEVDDMPLPKPDPADAIAPPADPAVVPPTNTIPQGSTE